jgi:hypothetical protein
MVSVSGRTDHLNERVILDLTFRPTDRGEGSVFVDMVLDLQEQLDFKGVTFDMALYPKHDQALMSAGLIAVSKVRLNQSGRLSRANLGEAEFKLKGHLVATKVVLAVSGAPCIENVRPDGEREWVMLLPGQARKRPLSGGGYTWYRNWSIPTDEDIPRRLRGAATLLRHSTTADEEAAGLNRSTALRLVHESDPEFAPLFGRREDTESMHNDMKQDLWNKRASCVGIARNTLRAHAYQVKTMLQALVANVIRTGRDAAQFLGAYRPPVPSTSAA